MAQFDKNEITLSRLYEALMGVKDDVGELKQTIADLPSRVAVLEHANAKLEKALYGMAVLVLGSGGSHLFHFLG